MTTAFEIITIDTLATINGGRKAGGGDLGRAIDMCDGPAKSASKFSNQQFSKLAKSVSKQCYDGLFSRGGM